MSGHEVLLDIAGGVALLLWATRMIRTGILRAYGADLRRVLGRSTRNRFGACGAGLAVTTLVQSSTATALLAVSFASRGLITTVAGLAIMLGADVGSTLVVQVLSFDISWLSPVLILIGVIGFLRGSSPTWRNLSRVMVGLGLMLLSLNLVVDASSVLRGSDILPAIMAPLASDPILALLLTAALTWVCHSSVAVVLLVMSFTVAGVVPAGLGMVMVLGANVGSGIIPMMLSLSDKPSARRIPLGNLLFRTLGALAVLPLVDWVMPYLAVLSPDSARQIANFHTLFNLVLAGCALPLIGVMGRLTERVFPDPAVETDPTQPKYLNPRVVNKPAEALACATREALRMADTVEMMLRGVIDVFPQNDAKLLARLSQLDDEVDGLHEAIKLYVSQVSQQCTREDDALKCRQIIDFTTNLEHVGDIIDKNILEIAQQKIDDKMAFSEEGWQELVEMHACILQQMQLAMNVFICGETQLARKLLAGKRRTREVERRGNALHLARLRSEQVESVETSGLHLDMLRDLKRIDSHLASIAYDVLEAHRRGAPQAIESNDANDVACNKKETTGDIKSSNEHERHIHSAI